MRRLNVELFIGITDKILRIPSEDPDPGEKKAIEAAASVVVERSRGDVKLVATGFVFSTVFVFFKDQRRHDRLYFLLNQ